MWILAVPPCQCVTGALFPSGHIAACSSWPGSAGRNTTAIKWDWGLIHLFLAYNFLFDHPGCAGWLAWLQGTFAVLWAEVRWGTGSKDLVQVPVPVSRTLPTVFMTKMKRRNVGASEWRGQILLFSAFLLFPDFSEDLTELCIISCLGQWLNTKTLTFFCSQQVILKYAFAVRIWRTEIHYFCFFT